MKSFIKNRIGIPFGALVILLSACTAEQDVAPIVPPTDNPVANIEPAGDYSSVSEGDTLSFTITVDKMVDQAIDWAPVLKEGMELVEGADYELDGGTLQPYSLSTEFHMFILADDFPEMTEQLAVDISAAGDPGYNFQLNPDSEVVSFDLGVENVNDPDQLSIGISWPDADDDWDAYVVDEDAGAFADAAETGDVPELMGIPNSSTSANFTIGIAAWAVEATSTTFELAIGYPDGEVELIEMTINLDEVEETDLAGNILMARVVKSDNTYSVVPTLD